MNRIYTDTSHFRSPYASVQFAGLGQEQQRWPAGRSYHDTSTYLAPYRHGYFQDNSLFGLGYDPAPPGVTAAAMPQRTTPSWMIVAGGVAAVAAVVGVAMMLGRSDKAGRGGAGVSF